MTHKFLKPFINSLILLSMLLGLLVGASPAAAAPMIVVTTTADEFGTGGACSLREAIFSANYDTAFGGCPAGAGDDGILLGAGVYTLTIGVDNEVADAEDYDSAIGDLDIFSPMTIQGAGVNETVVQSGSGSKTRVFHVSGVNGTGFRVTLRNFAVAGGYAYYAWDGTLVNLREETMGGGIFNDYGYLLLWRMRVTDNKARHSGGGVYSNRPSGNYLYILESTIQNNVAELGDGGGILNESPMLLTKSLVHNNTAAAGNGGGLYNNDNGGRVISTTIGNNNTNSTQGGGSGIYSDRVIEVVNSTIAYNKTTSTEHAALELVEGQGVLINNIIAYNKASVGQQQSWPDANCRVGSGALAPAGLNNMSQVVEQFCAGYGGSASFMKTVPNLNLSPTLANNYGLTQSYALLDGSGAIDTGPLPNNKYINPQTGLNYFLPSTDQRWAILPFDGDGNGSAIPDVGAVEYYGAQPPFINNNDMRLPRILR